MAEIVIFHYIHRNSVFHRMDLRIKLLCMILFSISSSLASEIPDFVVLTVVLLTAICVSKLPVMTLLKEFKNFAILIIFVIVIDSFTIPGNPIPIFSLPGVSAEGVATGLLFAWRLILIIMICTIMTGTSSLTNLKNAIEWYLRPIPFIPEARVATMINLTIVLIPVILDTVSEMSDAQKARCIEGRKNPIKRIMFIAFPLLVQTFRKADEMVFAMEARCYSENRTRAVLTATARGYLILVFSLLITAIVLFYNY
jgi:biotin transport system permease protein